MVGTMCKLVICFVIHIVIFSQVWYNLSVLLCRHTSFNNVAIFTAILKDVRNKKPKDKDTETAEETQSKAVELSLSTESK